MAIGRTNGQMEGGGELKETMNLFLNGVMNTNILGRYTSNDVVDFTILTGEYGTPFTYSNGVFTSTANHSTCRCNYDFSKSKVNLNNYHNIYMCVQVQGNNALDCRLYFQRGSLLIPDKENKRITAGAYLDIPDISVFNEIAIRPATNNGPETVSIIDLILF